MTEAEIDAYMADAAAACAEVEAEEANPIATKTLPRAWSLENGVVYNQFGEEV
jgi:hypothetical protein